LKRPAHDPRQTAQRGLYMRDWYGEALTRDTLREWTACRMCRRWSIFWKRSRNGSTIENVSVRDLTGSSEATSDTRENNRGDDPPERKANEDESRLTLDLAKQPRRSSCWQHFDQRLMIKGTRYAVCKECNKMLKQVKSAGTGTHRHHI
jgi:hypothetical protein